MDLKDIVVAVYFKKKKSYKARKDLLSFSLCLFVGLLLLALVFSPLSRLYLPVKYWRWKECLSDEEEEQEGEDQKIREGREEEDSLKRCISNKLDGGKKIMASIKRGLGRNIALFETAFYLLLR